MFIINHIKTWYVNLRIRYKLLLSFAILIIIPILITSSLYFFDMRQVLISKTDKYTNDILTEVKKSIELNLNDIDRVFYNIITNAEVQSALQYVKEEPILSLPIQYELETDISLILRRAFAKDRYIKSMYVKSYFPNDFLASAFSSELPLVDDEIVADVMNANGTAILLKTTKNYFTYVRSINSIDEFKPLGYFVIHYYEEYLYQIYGNISLSQNSQLFIIDSDGYVVSSGEKDLIGSQVSDNYQRALNDHINIFYGTGAFDDGKYYISSRTIDGSPWELVYQISEKEFNKEVVALFKKVLLITSLCLLIVLIFSFLLSSMISKPIIKLTQNVKLAQTGDYSTHNDYKSKDEVGVLSHNFNEMLKSTHHLIRVVYEKELMNQRAELELLRFQINPHFLYNTLETINWSARCNGLEEIGIMAKALGDLMRRALDANDFIQFRQELEDINNYLLIQKYRYGDKIQYQNDIDTKILDAIVPKFILQPIVENSIIHGIEPKLTSCHIIVTGELDYDDIVLTVEDDGVGIPQNVLENLLIDMDGETHKHKSIGIKNVHKRLQFIYGVNYGLSISSELGKTTKVVIKIPFST